MSALRRHILVLVTLVLAFAQGASAVHATEYGSDLHSHDGMVCDIALLEDDVEAALPAPVIVTLDAPVWEMVFETAIIDRAVPAHPARAPPPRGPPA